MLTYISSVLWLITTFIIIITSILISFYLNFPHFKLSKSVNKRSQKSKDNSFKLLNLTLAGKIGVGSISGIAISIIVGGKGTLLWIWVSSIFLSIFTYLETKTGIKYKEKINNDYIGGPQVYIKNRLKNKKLSFIYSLLIIFTFLFAFILIQSNTIILSVSSLLAIDKKAIILILSLVVYLSIKNGIKSISKMVSFLVPIMGFLYIMIGTYITIKNMNLIPSIIEGILKESFKIKSLFTIPFIIGFQRSIFSNETGMGSTTMMVALSDSQDYKKEARIQLFGMYFISLVICTISAILILTTNYEIININNINGIEIINYAFMYHFGKYGIILSNLIVTMFAFSTIITSSYYGEICIKYLFKNKKNTITKIIVIIVIVLSGYISTKNIWAFVDIATALTTMINLYALYYMKEELKE